MRYRTAQDFVEDFKIHRDLHSPKFDVDATGIKSIGSDDHMGNGWRMLASCDPC